MTEGATEDKPPPPAGRASTFRLLGHTLELCEGACDPATTGWRTWAGGWLLAKHLERRLAGDGAPLGRVLDLSCGTGLAGLALAKAGCEVVLSELPANVATVCGNARRNGLRPGRDVQVVAHTWGRPLPDEMRRPFSTVLCGDLLFHVWSDRLQLEFAATVQDLHRRREPSLAFELLFAGQVRSGRQEEGVLAGLCERLGLSREDLAIPAEEQAPGVQDAGPQLLRRGRHRLVRLHTPGCQDTSEATKGGDQSLAEIERDAG